MLHVVASVQIFVIKNIKLLLRDRNMQLNEDKSVSDSHALQQERNWSKEEQERKEGRIKSEAKKTCKDAEMQSNILKEKCNGFANFRIVLVSRYCK